MVSRSSRLSPRSTPFGEALRALRGAQTQKELGDLAGLSPSLIGHLERGHRAPTEKHIRRLAGPLGVQPSVLLDRAGILVLPLKVGSRDPEPAARAMSIEIRGTLEEVRLVELFIRFLRTPVGDSTVGGVTTHVLADTVPDPTLNS